MSASAELVPFTHQEGPRPLRELKERMDAFTNHIRLLWNQEDGSVHLDVSGFDIEVAPDKANDAFDHPYPLLAHEIGEVALDEFLLSHTEAN